MKINKQQLKNRVNAVLVKLLILGILMVVFYVWFSYRLNELVEISSGDVVKPQVQVIKVIEKTEAKK
jgi:amino acid permease